MTIDKTIVIQNIYYMLSYAFEELKRNNYENIAKEEFENIYDLLAEILYKGMSAQLKRGLHKEYISETGSLSVLKGRMDIRGTITEKINYRNRLICEYDELSEDILMNQVLKTTISTLLYEKRVKRSRKNRLRELMPYFSGVQTLDIYSINWNSFVYQRNNQTYRMLMNICNFILDGMLLTTEKGQYRLSSFTEHHMEKLFEHFVLEYFRKHHKGLSANPDKIKWNISSDDLPSAVMLPDMKSDIVLHKGDKRLIIDTKYYGSSYQTNFDKATIHSSNLYQIFSYVKNLDKDSTGKVSGLLLYAKTDEDISPELSVLIGGNRISVRTLDLNRPFTHISKQLDDIVSLI